MTSTADLADTSADSAPRAIFGDMPTTTTKLTRRAAMLGNPDDLLDANEVAAYLSQLRNKPINGQTVRNYRRNRVHDFPVADLEIGGRPTKAGDMLPAYRGPGRPQERPAAQNAAGQWERIRPDARRWKRSTIFDWNASRPSTD